MEPVDYNFLAEFYSGESMRRASREIAGRLNRILPYGKTLAFGFHASFLDLLEVNKARCVISNADKTIAPSFSRGQCRTVIFNDDYCVSRLASCSCDAVLAVHYLEFLPKNDDLLLELFRILKNNGKLIVISVNKNRIGTLRFSDRVIKNVKLSPQDLISSLTTSTFEIDSIFGVNEKFNFWPYSFSYKLNKYSEIFIRFFPLFSDVIIMSASKSAMISEATINLEEQYGTT
ncbi:MAG: class I SAM-dependent methyltransferase [Holosporaceae bacterium]|jgi:SAM-dependent methyltransferase|nr:class I SAM-dependent methyltransferase [Holosporaceae bacterium]